VATHSASSSAAEELRLWLATWLAPNGFLILIEPALRELSRDLLLVRDRLLDILPLTVYSPCVHSLPCPAVGPGCVSDWCHEDQSWQAPEWIRQIDERIGLRKSSLKYSYVVLTRTGLSVRDVAPEATSLSSPEPGTQSRVWRVVSERLEERGKSVAYLCGMEGRHRVTRLDKHASSVNADFGLLGRGQTVSTGPLELRGLERRVESGTPVRILTGRPERC